MRDAPPSELGSAVEAALAGIVRSPRIARIARIGGGCINHASRLTTEGGDHFFLKWNARATADTFVAEADGLAALASAGALRVPRVIAVGETPDQAQSDGGAPAWLLLEYVAPGRPGLDYSASLGEGLARLHRSARRDARAPAAPPAWGWERDNFIGSLAQSNEATDTWGAFWRDRRIAPQLERARARGHFGGSGSRALDVVLERTEDLLSDVEAEGACLLHGDFWGGNVYPDGEGRPVLIDPAVFRGHREVDIAMSELFGGFPRGWPDAYGEACPLDPGYREFRRALYQLYYLLVHVNLFGSSYEEGCLAAAHEVVAVG